MDDPYTDRLSEYLDGELSQDELRSLEHHVAQCESCARTLRELRAVRAAARELTDRAPPRDLWPGVRAALAPRRRRPLLPIAALALVAAAALVLWLWPRAAERAAGRQFMLILHRETAPAAGMSAAQRTAIVDEYRRWAVAMRRADHLVDGNELGSEGSWVLHPQEGGPRAERQQLGNEDQRVTGYFVIRAKDEADAVAIAKGCPHLRLGGWIELRPIEDV
jgi:hypothetical protein